MAAKRVIEKHGLDNTILLFTDTFMEHDDLYRFLIESTCEIFGIVSDELADMCHDIPPITDMDRRKGYIQAIAKLTMKRNPQLVWVWDGRSPWEVFKDVRWIGNSRVAQCSHSLKQDAARKWLEANYQPNEATLYLGIDWSEIHRTKAPIENWSPYEVVFPMCEEPFLDKQQMLDELTRVGIEVPVLYKFNFPHNNCFGGCVRGGQGHWKMVLEKIPEVYAYSEQKEEEMRQYLGKDVSILKRTRNKIQYPLTLRQLREEIEANKLDEIDLFDFGGCGCFVDSE